MSATLFPATGLAVGFVGALMLGLVVPRYRVMRFSGSYRAEGIGKYVEIGGWLLVAAGFGVQLVALFLPTPGALSAPALQGGSNGGPLGGFPLGAVAGGLTTALAAGLALRWRRANAAKALAEAFWEELNATGWGNWATSGAADYWQAGGFTSQTFDTQFALMAEVLPPTLQRALMRYHWQMKYIVGFEDKTSQYPPGGHGNKAHDQWLDLLPRLRAYADRDAWELLVNREEER